MANFLTPAVLQVSDASANPLAGAKEYVYATGTTTLLSLFSNEALSTPQANPMIADSAGVFPICFIAETKFKVILKSSADVTLYTRDPVFSTGRADNVSAANVTFDGTGIGFSSTNVQAAIVELYGSVAHLSGASFTGAIAVSGNSTGTLVSATSTDSGSVAGPSFETYRASTSPAAADILGEHLFFGRGSTGVKKLYASVTAVLTDPTLSSENGELTLRTTLASTIADRVHIRAGAYMDGATGGDKGVGTFNATALYAQGVRVGGMPDAVLEDQKTVSTTGGNFASGAWRARDLNTEVRDAYGLITLASNQFTPTVAGWIEWQAPAFKVNLHQSRLYNVTDSVAVAVGASSASGSVEFVTSTSNGGGAVVAGKTYRIEHQCSTTNAAGFGNACSFGTEVYTRVLFYRTD